MQRFPVRTPEQLEEWIRARLLRATPGFSGCVVVHTLREEYIRATTREECKRQGVAMWGKDSRSDWHWFEVDATPSA